MSIRTDVTVDWNSSPRVLTVSSPSTSIVIQDLYDTARDFEDTMVGMGHDELISAGGKEDLGGGSAVGITATLLNALLAFEARGGPAWDTCTVSAGNLVAVDDIEAVQPHPFSETAYVNILYRGDTSAALVSGGGGGDATEAKQDTIIASLDYHTKIINNLKEIKKISGSWYLIIYDDGEVSGGTEVLRKKLTDKDGNDITDLDAGVLAAELENSV